ncbi:MAG: Sjogren's syndrome/scleroderma autoantigen 1 family protein [Methanoculleaceae archaeon]
MGEDTPDEVMAEYLLKGAKMLAKTCQECGSPLFEYKGRTFCVVCEKMGEEGREAADPDNTRKAVTPVQGGGRSVGSGDGRGSIEDTITHLCARICDERDPDDCHRLAEAVLCMAKALECLSHR